MQISSIFCPDKCRKRKSKEKHGGTNDQNAFARAIASLYSEWLRMVCAVRIRPFQLASKFERDFVPIPKLAIGMDSQKKMQQNTQQVQSPTTGPPQQQYQQMQSPPNGTQPWQPVQGHQPPAPGPPQHWQPVLGQQQRQMLPSPNGPQQWPPLAGLQQEPASSQNWQTPTFGQQQRAFGQQQWQHHQIGVQQWQAPSTGAQQPAVGHQHWQSPSTVPQQQHQRQPTGLQQWQNFAALPQQQQQWTGGAPNMALQGMTLAQQFQTANPGFELCQDGTTTAAEINGMAFMFRQMLPPVRLRAEFVDFREGQQTVNGPMPVANAVMINGAGERFEVSAWNDQAVELVRMQRGAIYIIYGGRALEPRMRASAWFRIGLSFNSAIELATQHQQMVQPIAQAPPAPIQQAGEQPQQQPLNVQPPVQPPLESAASSTGVPQQQQQHQQQEDGPNRNRPYPRRRPPRSNSSGRPPQRQAAREVRGRVNAVYGHLNQPHAVEQPEIEIIPVRAAQSSSSSARESENTQGRQPVQPPKMLLSKLGNFLYFRLGLA
uniref:Uncharacterized protein n=1 Tax=Globodera rostochiensis TaxID=31243 RepID=A0A914HF66_GLORO